MLVGSLVELISAGKLCDDTDYCGKEFGWAVAVGTISMVLFVFASKTRSGKIDSIAKLDDSNTNIQTLFFYYFRRVRSFICSQLSLCRAF